MFNQFNHVYDIHDYMTKNHLNSTKNKITEFDNIKSWTIQYYVPTM